MRGTKSIITLLLVLMFTFGSVSPALASKPKYPAPVERWRPIVRSEMAHCHVPQYQRAWVEAAIMRIISRESGGSQTCGHRRGCYGLLQFNTGWIRHSSDWRGNGRASIRRFMWCFSRGGKIAIRRHWKATIGNL